MNQAEISTLQSRLCYNAAAITALTAKMRMAKVEARFSQLRASRQFLRGEASRLRTAVIELAGVQKGIKRDLLASKYARLQAAGKGRTKHGMDDPRYEAWASQPGAEQHGVAL